MVERSRVTLWAPLFVLCSLVVWLSAMGTLPNAMNGFLLELNWTTG